jgi:hypothetical protein
MLAFLSSVPKAEKPEDSVTDEVADITVVLKYCGGTIVPCGGAAVDTVVVETEMLVWGMTMAELLKARKDRKNVTDRVWLEMCKDAMISKNGTETDDVECSLNPEAVHITGIKDTATTRVRRQLSTSATVSIAVTVNTDPGTSAADAKADVVARVNKVGGVSASKTSASSTKGIADEVSASNPATDSSSDGLGAGALAGIVVGGLAAVALVVVGAVTMSKKKQNPAKNEQQTVGTEVSENKKEKLML